MNPWESILKKALGSEILLGVGALERNKGLILRNAEVEQITLSNIGEKWLDSQFAQAKLPPLLSLFKSQLITAVNAEVDHFRQAAPSDDEALFQLLCSYLGTEATKLGA